VTALAVIGHVEWVQFARVERVPRAGEVVHAHGSFEEPAGGGAVAAVQLARLAGAATLFTALGDDELGRRSVARLQELGVEVRHVTRGEPTRRAVTLLDAGGERTITTFGPRLEPHGNERELPWQELRLADGVYFTAGDDAALGAARAAGVVVASPRARQALGHRIELDALVLSAGDDSERESARRAIGEAELVAYTEGAQGGRYELRGGGGGRWLPTPLDAPAIDSYGCGDSFAAGLAFALAGGLPTAEALALASRCGAVCATGRGPYERQLDARALGS
jgi:ribokinase